MISILSIVVLCASGTLVFIGLTYVISSIGEREQRASMFAGFQLLILTAVFVILGYAVTSGFFGTSGGIATLIGIIILGGAAGAIFILPIGKNHQAELGTKGLIQGEVTGYDERDQVFARNRALKPGTEQYKAYYKAHPELEEYDTQRRAKGGPLGKPGKMDSPHDGPIVAGIFSSLSIPFLLSKPEAVKPKKSPHFKREQINISPEEATTRIKGYAKKLGADLVGVTEIHSNWVYSHRGEIFHNNWEDWGKNIELTHKFALVFAVEMDFDFIGAAPHSPTAFESMMEYAKAAFISIQIANYIANLGYSATANHLRHYELVLVPLAVDAGLGELGRIGYLMTKEFGPRVRLGAVSTDLALIPDQPVDIGVEDFCKICKKCAVCCPSRSIPFEDQAVNNGILRWKLDEESCFNYWGNCGTDCNICMRVCPWSHYRSFPHNFIREMISCNKFSRRVFSVMDDIFYGKNPKSKKPPSWAKY